MAVFVLIFITGLCAGSFALVLATRMFEGRDWVNGRSECDNCHKILSWYELIPLISWLASKGKCRQCHRTIGVAYPLIELSVGFCFGLSYRFWPYGFTKIGIAVFVLWLIMLTILASLVVFDIKWGILPDKLVYTLVGLAGASKLAQMAYFQSVDKLPGLVLGIAVGWGIFYLLYSISKGKYIGGGDVKYGLFFGILLGSGLGSMMVISLSSIIGTMLILPSMITRKTKLQSAIPFGPSLIVATFIMYIFGGKLIEIVTTTYLFP